MLRDITRVIEFVQEHVEERPKRETEEESNRMAQLVFPARMPALLVAISKDTTIEVA